MKDIEKTDKRCLVCGGETRLHQRLSPGFIASALERFTEATVPADLAIPAYEIRRCSECSLEFAHPPTPADDAFYDWLDREGNYYTSERWEWDQVTAIIEERERPGERCSVLEIGAGAGHFLKRVQSLTGGKVIAIERSEDAVASLSEQGIEAYTFEQAEELLSGQTFDFVVAFHCLEHTHNPLAFVASMSRWAGPQGRIFFSVPYSPMFFESLWYDPLNHPPHHITRWSKRSLAKLAECVGGRAELSMPKALSVFARARLALCIYYQGPHWYRHRKRAWIVPFLHPLHYLKELVRQSKRERVNGQTASDVVLVEVCRNPH